MTYTLELDADYIAEVAEQFGYSFDEADTETADEIAMRVFAALDGSLEGLIVRAIDYVCD